MELKPYRFSKIFPDSALIGVIVSLSLLMSGCYSTKKANGFIKKYDDEVVSDKLDSLNLPPGVTLKILGSIPQQTLARKNYFMIFPMIVVNVFQSNHKLTLGQSSLEKEPLAFLKKEITKKITSLPTSWKNLNQDGYSIDIVVQGFETTGVFVSGYFSVFGNAGKGEMGKIRVINNVKSKTTVSLKFLREDSLLLERVFSLSLKANHFVKGRMHYMDPKTHSKVLMPDKQFEITNLYGKTIEDLILSEKEIFELSTEEIADMIVKTIENYLRDFVAER